MRERLVVGSMMVGLLTAALSGAARADEVPDVSTDNELAKLHFRVGAEHYARGEYDKAILEFQAAYEVVPLPALHYDLGRCHERLGHTRAALAEYTLYLDSAPDVASRRSVQEHSAELKASLKASLRATLPTSLPASIGVVGLGALATGLGLYYGAGARYDDCVARLTAAPCTSPRIDSTQALERGGIGMLVAGGVLLAADVGLWVAWARGRHPR